MKVKTASVKSQWLDPANAGSSKLVYFDMNLGGKSAYQEQDYFTQCLVYLYTSLLWNFSPCLNFFFRLIFNQTSMIANASITFVTKMQTTPILLDSIIALAKKDLLGMDTRAQVK